MSGIVASAASDKVGESHRFSQAAGPYWLAETIKVNILVVKRVKRNKSNSHETSGVVHLHMCR